MFPIRSWGGQLRGVGEGTMPGWKSLRMQPALHVPQPAHRRNWVWGAAQKQVSSDSKADGWVAGGVS